MEPVFEQIRKWFVSGMCILLAVLCVLSVLFLYKTKRSFTFDQRILAAEAVRVSKHPPHPSPRWWLIKKTH